MLFRTYMLPDCFVVWAQVTEKADDYSQQASDIVMANAKKVSLLPEAHQLTRRCCCSPILILLHTCAARSYQLHCQHCTACAPSKEVACIWHLAQVAENAEPVADKAATQLEDAAHTAGQQAVATADAVSCDLCWNKHSSWPWHHQMRISTK